MILAWSLVLAEKAYVGVLNPTNSTLTANPGMGVALDNEPSCSSPPIGMVAWYRGENTANDAFRRNDGTSYNGANFTTGKVGEYAFNFDGINDYVYIPDTSGDLRGGPNITIEGWVNFASLNAATIFSKTCNFDTDCNSFLIFYDGSNLRSYLGSNGFSADDQIIAPFSPTLGTWYHIAFVFDDTSNIQRLFIDGSEAATWNDNDSLFFDDSPITLGAEHLGPGFIFQFFKGAIDEVGFYGRALNATEIQAIHAAGSAGKCLTSSVMSCHIAAANLEAWFRAENSAADQLGINNGGTLGGTGTYSNGKVGQSFEINDTDAHVTIPDHPAQRPTSALTIEGWFKFDNLSRTPIISKPHRDRGSHSYLIYYDHNSNGGELIARHGNNSGSIGDYDSLNSGFKLYEGAWYHIAYTFDAALNIHKLFVNGAQIASATTEFPLSYDANPHPLLIGGDYYENVPLNAMDGLVDEVSVYSRALSQAEIQAIHGAVSIGKCLPSAGLDPSFDEDGGGDGKVTKDFNPTNQPESANAIAFQADGKIVTAGSAFSPTTSATGFALVRHNIDGSIDTSFGTAGTVTQDFGTSATAHAVAIQSDGRIVAAGTAGADFALVRFNTNGSLDLSFDGDGMVMTDFSGSNDDGYAIAIQPDGKIIVAGSASDNSVVSFALARYNANGTLDSTFNGNGKLTTGFSGFDTAEAIVLQNDGKIVVAGSAGGSDFALARYNTDGTLNTTFGGDGKVTTDFANSAQVRAAAIQSDGRVVVAGAVYLDGLNTDFALARYNTDGTLDTTFDGDGMVITEFSNDFDEANAVAVQSNGKIVAAGFADNGSNVDFGLARYTTNGSLDTTFDGDGKVTTDFFAGDDIAAALGIQSDGKIVAAGSARNGTNQVFALARYLSEPALTVVPSFSVNDVSVAEGDSGASQISFTVSLSPAPTQPAALSYSTSNGTALANGDYVAVSPTVLTFNVGEANKTVSITVNGDQDFEPNETFNLNLSAPTNATIADNQGIGTITNDDVNNAAPTISDIYDQTTNEDTPTDAIAFTVGDLETPATNLVVTATSSDTNLVPNANIALGGSGSSRSVTITPRADRSGTATITATVTDELGRTATDTFVLTINSVNDPPTISDISDRAVTEDTSTGTIQFQITKDILTMVEVTGSSSNTNLVPNANIVFGGFSTMRTVTVTPADNQSGTTTITVTVTDSTGAAASDTFVLTVNAVDDPPTISDISDQTTNEDTPTGAIAFMVSDPDTPADTLTVSGSSSNEPLVPPGNIVFGGTEGSRTIAVTPVANQFGTATITVTVTDPGGLTASDTFSLTVNSVNDAPAISNINNQSINPNSATDALQFTISDIETAAANLVVVGNSSNTTLVPNANITFGGSGENRTVTVTPVANQTGSALISVTVTDANGATTVEPFSLTVNGVSLETLHHISFGTPVIQIAGFGFDPQNRPAAGWGESSSNGGVNNFSWSRRVEGVWAGHTMDQPGGGIRAAQADFILRQDGKPFFAYAIRDAWIYGQDWYTAHIVDLDLFPNGHGSSVQVIESGQSCISAYPKFAMDFAPNASSPSFLLGTHCSYSGWLSLDNATVHGEPAFRTPAGTGGEFHSLDYARGPLGSHHVTYYSERGGPNWGAYYSNGSPGHELLLVKPHRNRAAETSVAVDADGRIHVAIGGVPLCDNTFEGGLLYLTSTDGVNWTRMFVDDISGRNPSITLDAAGKPRIAYWRQNAEVRLASLEADAWTTTPIYTATTPLTRASVKLAFDADNQPHVLFFNPDASDIQMSSGLPSNRPPMVTNPGSKASEVGQNISFQIVTSDSESDTLSFSACNLPPGLSIHPGTGLITGTITGPPANHQVTITVGDVANNSTSITFNWLTIPQGAAYQLAFVVQPTNTNTPNAISPAVKVVVQDLFGNTLNDAVDSVTIALANNPGGSTLSGGLTRNAVNGVSTFDDLRLDQAGTGYALRATSGSLVSATSDGFDIFHPAVIEVTEQILVTDAPSLLPSAVINVSENIVVEDAPVLLPSAVINVSENIAVQDAPALLPAAMLNIIEQINVLDTPAFWPPVATPSGANVSVQVGNVTITFNNVSTAGFTSIVPIDPASAGTLPAGFTLCAGCPAYEITTTAAYTPPITIALTVPGVTDQVFGQLKMLHGENGVLVDRTTARNFISREIFGSVNSLSPFVIVQDASVTTPTPTPSPTVNAGQVIISEFRLRGPGNNAVATGTSQKPLLSKASSIAAESGSAANDEFVEIYNVTDSDITVSTTDGSEGWALAASDGVARFVIPNGTVIPARAHFLGVNSAGYSLSAFAAADIEYTTDIPDNAGIALFRTANAANFSLDDRLDAVGSISETNALYREGAGYPAFTSADLALNLEHTFYRSLCSFQWGVGCATPGYPRDTDENAVDFLFVDTNGALTAAGQRLGAPGPENLASPIRRESAMPFVLLDASVAAAAPPNRIRNTTGDPANASTFGTLALPRRITNNTGGPVTRLQFRIVELTTWPAPSGMADLRARTTGGSFTIAGINDPNTCAATGTPITTPCMVTVQPTTLMQLPNQSGSVGGGQNAVLAAGTITMSEPLQNGQSINVQFLLGVQQTGLFRFLIIIEALP